MGRGGGGGVGREGGVGGWGVGVGGVSEKSWEIFWEILGSFREISCKFPGDPVIKN